MRIPARKRAALWSWLLVFVLVFGLAGCGASEGSTEDEAASTEAASTETGQPQPAFATGGSPWVNSNEGGNLPIEQPELKDDLYLYTNYDYIADHGLTGGTPIAETQSEISNSVTELIKDASKTSPALDQLRIFYNQLSDLDARAQTGLSDVQPYYDRIQAAQSVDELNALLSSADFPFVPVLNAYVSPNDMRAHNAVSILPKFVLADGASGGAEYYQPTDDEHALLMQNIVLAPELLKTRSVFMMLGRAADVEEAANLASDYLTFEASWGKYGDYTGKWTDTPYGAYGTSFKMFTLEELEKFCPNIPIKALLAKCGVDGSDAYTVSSSEWLSALSDLWTNDNLDNLKTFVTLSMMKDCFPILDPNLYKDYYEAQKLPVPDAEASAYEGCNKLGTMSNAIAKVYVDDVLGATAKERLTQLTNDLIDSYRGTFSETTWMSDAAKQSAIEKLDHMTANILEPDGGYWDYSKLSLTPTEQGGTLFSNLLTIWRFRADCDRALIGQPAKAIGPWGMIRATEMNCFYDPANNCINILPGYVTSYTYTDSMSEQELLAGIGAVIGHEVSHGFDYLGSQLDAYGVPNPIFSGNDATAFLERRQRLVDYFDTIQISDGVYVNGNNKSVEGAADLCGVQAILARAKQIDGMDYAKLFQDYAHLWCQVYPAGTTLALATDTHPLNYLRANAMVQMFDEFYDAYGITEGDGMYLAPDKRVAIFGANA